MTRVFVDHREIKSPGDASSISQILRCVDGAYLDKDSVISQIQVNGRPLALDVCGSAQPGTPGLFEKPNAIEVLTGNIAEIARGSIVEALAYLDRIESVTPSLAMSFRDGPMPDSFEYLRQLNEGFYWLNLLLDRLETDFKIRIEDICIRAGSELEYRRKFTSILRQLVESREKGDLIRIAGLLEREILPLVPFWREVFRAVAQKAGVAEP
jgi:hypothetical protein